MNKVNGSGKLLIAQTQKSEDDAPDISNSAATSDNRRPRLSSTRSSPPAQIKLETKPNVMGDAPKVDSEPRFVSRDMTASDAKSSPPSAAASGNSTEHLLFNLVQGAGISRKDFQEKIWPTLRLYLPDSIECDPALARILLIVCDKVRNSGEENREFAQTCAEPLSRTDVPALEKILLLESFLKLNGDMYERVADAVASTFDVPAMREALYELLTIPYFDKEDLPQWLDQHPTAKSEFLEITKEYCSSAAETKAAWKMFRDVLPFPCVNGIKEDLAPVCASFFQMESNKRPAFFDLIWPLIAPLPRDLRICPMASALQIPEAYRERLVNCLISFDGDFKTLFLESILRIAEEYRERLVNILIFSKRNPAAYQLPNIVFMSKNELVNALQEGEKKIAQGLNILDVPREDVGMESVVVERFPALQIYNACNRAPNDDHLKDYGELSIQEKFQSLQRSSLYFALKSILQGKESKDKKSAFREILSGLGKRRMHTAYVCNSAAYLENHDCDVTDWAHFGSPVSGPGDLTVIPSLALSYTYKEWAQKIISHGSNSITIRDVAYQLTRVGEYGFGYCYCSFWDENDPVFSHSCENYEQINGNELIEPEKIRVLLSQLHWVLVGTLPFYRGTAAIAESLSDAIWISHGYIPPPGKTLDLLALSTSQEDFAKVYPMGTKWSLEQQ